MSAIDFDFRPTGYFQLQALSVHLLSTVKGAARQKHIRSLIEAGRLDQLEEWMGKQSLSDPERTIAGQIHPSYMGGEYLSDLSRGEIEIARISLESVTGDVTSIRAFRGKGPIRYRIVDEYMGDTLSNKTTRISKLPLTLGQLEKFIEGAGAGMEIMRFTLERAAGDLEKYRSFLKATSPFYPQLSALYQLRVDDLIKSLMPRIEISDESLQKHEVG